jgi:hypothetical protein
LYHTRGPLPPENRRQINEIKNKIIKITNIILAMAAAVPAIPPNPNIAAIIATIKNTTAHHNMSLFSFETIDIERSLFLRFTKAYP